MPRYAHQSAALVLAAIFAVVGGTGEALYYLVEADRCEISSPEPDCGRADSGQLASSQDRHRKVYSHHHGDGLWHYHTPKRSRSDRIARSVAVSVEDRGTPSDSVVRKSSQDHQPHTCLVLALVSQIQQSLANAAAIHGADDHPTFCYELVDCRLTCQFRPTLGARGPPLLPVSKLFA